MDVNYIYELEKKYHSLLSKILFSEKFISSISKLEKTSIEDKKDISEKWLQTNSIETLIERVIRFYVYGKGTESLNILDAYHSPLSSDVAFETNDAIIFIDAKTIDKKSNPGDLKSVPYKPNQITFENIPVYKGQLDNPDNKDESFEFSGINFPNISTKITKNGIYRNKKPILTFVIGLHYLSNKNFITNHEFEERELYLVSMPHYETAREFFDNDIISNFKTYEYIDSEKEYEKYPKYKPFKEEGKKILIPFRPNPRGATFYFEPNKNSPLFNDSDLIWGKPTKKKQSPLYDHYQAVLYGSAARTLKTRFSDNKNESWRIKQYFFD